MIDLPLVARRLLRATRLARRIFPRSIQSNCRMTVHVALKLKLSTELRLAPGDMIGVRVGRLLRRMASSSRAEASRNLNRLAKEKSPYLLQHASNPVDW